MSLPLNPLDYTKAQWRVLLLLEDGEPHTKEEIAVAAKVKEGSTVHATYMHVSKLRKILRPKGQDIICEYVSGKLFYRYVRLIGRE